MPGPFVLGNFQSLRVIVDDVYLTTILYISHYPPVDPYEVNIGNAPNSRTHRLPRVAGP